MWSVSVQHIPYRSLEQFRIALTSQYLEIYKSDVVVQEKIHGSNISIVGLKNLDVENGWEFQLGSRRRWISPDEKFNNIQSLFESHRTQIIRLFNKLFERFYVDEGEQPVIRLFGEVFGGKYGGSKEAFAFRTQCEPNYGPSNDFAFFDAFVGGVCVPVDDFIEIIPEFGLKIAPVIYRGPLSNFLASFNVNEFKSVVSKEFYGLEYIDQPKATEGVVIRTVNPKASKCEATVLKYKQTWAVENPRVIKSRIEKTSQSSCSQFNDCMEMLNENRLISYKSKNTIEDLTNPRLIGTHVKEIVADTMRDVVEEFPPNKFPDLNQREVSRALSKKAFPLFKNYIEQIGRESLPNSVRLQNASNEHSKLCAEINSLKTRIDSLHNRLTTLGH